MSRPLRRVTHLVRALSGPVATLATPFATTVIVATAVTACKDEGQPEYWVEKLNEPAWQAQAIKRLEQFFEDAYTRANKDITSEEMKKLADQTLEPLVNTYVNGYDNIDDKTREQLIKLIASFRDQRGEPALKKAFEEFAKRGKGGSDIKWASRAQKEMKLDALQEPIIQTFDKLKASTPAGGGAYRDLKEALLAHPSKAWSGILKMKLETEMEIPKDAKDPELVSSFRNQQFWQATAAQLLGEIRDESAVDPLLKVMLDPAKADIQSTAALALVKIGRPAMDKTAKLLSDQAQDLASFGAVRYQKATGQKPTGKPHIATAAVVLGVMGRKDAVEPMIAALGSAGDDGTKAVIARELAKLPATPASKQAFKSAYESISLEASIPPGANALQVLTEASTGFYDPDFVPWLVQRGGATKGGDVDLQKALQSTVTVAAIKLMKPDQAGLVKGAVNRWGTDIEKDAYKQATELLQACGDRTSCYLAALEKGENQEQKTQFIAIKAAYMLGIYGDEKARDGIVERLDAVENAAARFTAAQTIDFLSPTGSKEVADATAKILDKNVESADQNKIQADAPLKQVMYRIRARAE